MMLAIDPGAEHVGWVLFNDDNSVREYGEHDPETFLRRLATALHSNRLTQLVVEEFRLYPWKAQAKQFDTLREVEVIGVVKWLAVRAHVPIEMQPARVMKVTEGHLRAEGRQPTTHGRHARAAELHGRFWINRKRWKEERDGADNR
jgi:hypothetical protein